MTGSKSPRRRSHLFLAPFSVFVMDTGIIAVTLGGQVCHRLALPHCGT